jgi:hypothetical protein
MRVRSLGFAFLALAVFSSETAAQTPPQGLPPATQRPGPPNQRPDVFGTGVLRLFLDCQYECDDEFITKELTFVDHVRDSQSADIHALVTTESTGGGGTSWTIQFMGLGRFAGYNERVKFTTTANDSSDQRRRALLKWLKAALATPAALASGKADFDVVMPKVDAAAAPAVKQKDPWNAWVFNLNTNGNISGEESSKYASYRFNAGGSRVTEAWKFSFNTNWNRSTSTFEVSDTETVESLTSSWNNTALAVKSLTPKWSAAVRATLNGSTFSNYDYTGRLMAGIEYDFFPYSESTRRSLTVAYMVGVAHYNFEEVTIFDKLTDTNPEHQLLASLGLRQKWGSVGFYSQWSQHLDDVGKTRFNIFGDADVRLFKGFSFNFFGDYSRIRDQINLRKGDIAEEEVLLRLRQLATGYSYYFGFGISYRFGSIFNNVVNPRFRNFF